MPLFSRESLEHLRGSIKILEVISDHIEVKKQGASYKALCPFHDEKTPSFTIDNSDGHYHCFGCGAHGDAIQFLQEHQRCTFYEAVERLAEKFRIPLIFVDKEDIQEGGKRAKLKEALEFACQYYQFMLLHTEKGRKAVTYLLERGLDLDFIQKFRLGYAIDEAGLFVNTMEKRGVNREILEEAGLLVKGTRKDFFSERITFPIHHQSGFIIGFSARKYKESTFGGKYINSPETKLFKKSKLLFGLNYARRTIAKLRKVLIVEGQIDALRLIDAGFDYAVAAQGTAFGEEQPQELIKLGVMKAYLCLDADEAGINAAVKLGDLLLSQGVEGKVISLPQGEDPDSFLRKEGREKFKERLEKAEDYLDFLFRVTVRGLDLTSPAVKKRVVEEITAKIARYPNDILVRASLKKLATLADLPESMVIQGAENRVILPMQRVSYAGIEKIDPHLILESDFLRGLLLLNAKGSDYLKIAEINMTASYFIHPLCRLSFQKILDFKEPFNLLHFTLSLQDPSLEVFIQELLSKKGKFGNVEKGFFEAMQKILDREWMERREFIRRKMQSGGLQEKEVFQLLKEFEEIKKQEPRIKYLDGTEKRVKG